MNPKPVIVKAYSDEPVRLMAMEVIGESVVVAGDDRERTIGFRKDLVFEFDEQLFAKLRAAYDHRETKTVRQLWTQARSFVSD
jgi:hypothetical protein